MKVGDVVIVDGGRRAMTVARIDGDGMVCCNWFVNYRLYRRRFLARRLLRVRPKRLRP